MKDLLIEQELVIIEIQELREKAVTIRKRDIRVMHQLLDAESKLRHLENELFYYLINHKENNIKTIKNILGIEFVKKVQIIGDNENSPTNIIKTLQEIKQDFLSVKHLLESKKRELSLEDYNKVSEAADELYYLYTRDIDENNFK